MRFNGSVIDTEVRPHDAAANPSLPQTIALALHDVSAVVVLLWFTGTGALAGAFGYLVPHGGIWVGRDPIPLWWLVLAGAAVLTALSAPVTVLNRLRVGNAERTAKAEAERLQWRIREVNRAFEDAARLLRDLQTDLDRQQARRAKVLLEVAAQKDWLASTRPEAEQARRAYTRELRGRDRAQSRENRIYFIVGIILSIPIGILINLLTS